MRFLAIDYGSKRVGIAISDEEGKMAFPYKILPNDMALLDSIHNICGEEEVSASMLCESRDLAGHPNKTVGSTEKVKHN